MKLKGKISLDYSIALLLEITFVAARYDLITGGPSSSCELIILRNNSHGGIIRVCMGIFTTAQAIITSNTL